jgi:hypothetical protein
MHACLTIAALTFLFTAMPASARAPRDGSPVARFLIEEYSLAETSGSDSEKLRTARYGLRDPNDDDYESVPDSTRFRWKLNRVKMRMPIDTSGIR